MRQNAALCGNGLTLHYITICQPFFNPLLNDKILDVRKLKAFADDKLNVA